MRGLHVLGDKVLLNKSPWVLSLFFCLSELCFLFAVLRLCLESFVLLSGRLSTLSELLRGQKLLLNLLLQKPLCHRALQKGRLARDETLVLNHFAQVVFPLCNI